MTSISNWYAISNCMKNNHLEIQHFFRFTKEHDRWLVWVQACGRSDLYPKGPNYTHRNMRLCHLHFEDKLITIKKRAALHPDVITTKFMTLYNMNMTISAPVEEILSPLPILTEGNERINVKAEIVEPVF